MFYLNGFSQLIAKPTRIIKDSPTLIEIIATKTVENISHANVIGKRLSHHGMVV